MASSSNNIYRKKPSSSLLALFILNYKTSFTLSLSETLVVTLLYTQASEHNKGKHRYQKRETFQTLKGGN